MGCLDDWLKRKLRYLDDWLKLPAQNRVRKWLPYLCIVFLVAMVITPTVVLILRFAVKPHVEASIEDARLDTFALSTMESGRETTPSFLAYNISVAISVHNPTAAFVKHTKPLLAAIAFHDNSLLNVSVASRGHKYRPSKKEVHRLLESGEVPLDALGSAALEDFKKQNKTGVFKVEVRLSGEIAYLGLDIIGNKRNLGFSCPLNLQLAPPGHGVILFHEVKCKAEPENIYFF